MININKRFAPAIVLAAVGMFCVGPVYSDTAHVASDTNINLATPGQINGTAIIP